MPRLPDDSVLGGLPSANSGRTTASFDTTAPGRAMESMGKGISDLGKGVAAGIKSYADDKSELDETRAKSGYLTEKVKLDEERDNETDPEKLKAFPGRYQEVADKWGNTLPDGRKREKWNLTMAPTIAKDGVPARDKLQKVEQDAALAESKDHMETLRQIGVDPASSEADRNMALELGQEYISNLEDSGYYNKQQAQAARQKWVRDYVYDAIRTIDPIQRVAGLGGVKEALKIRESGGDPTIVNQFGYAGFYQFGAPRLQTMGVYTPGDDENMGSWSKTGRNAPGKWTGTFSIPGFPQVKTLQDFRANPDAQEAAFAIHDQKMEQEIKSLGLEKYVGQTIGGVKITVDGIKAMMHLGGAGGAKATLESGGSNDRSDANGTSLLNYAKMGQGGRTELAGVVAPDDQRFLLDEARNEAKKSYKVQQAARQEETARVTNDVDQDIASIEKTGVGRDGLTLDRVALALGEEKAAEWEGQRTRAKRYFDAFDGAETMSTDDLGARVDALAPKGGSPDFTEQNKLYEKARKRVDSIREERETDPAVAAERSPIVKSVRQAAEYSGDGTAQVLTPNSAQSIIAARMEAQRQLGIMAPSPITRTEGAVIARQLRMIGEDNTQGIDRLMRQLTGTYGDYAGQVLTAALVQEKVNRDLASISTEVLQKVAAGQAPAVPTAQAAVSAADNQQITDAMAGRQRRTIGGDKSLRQGLRAQEGTLQAQGEQQAREAAPANTYDPADVRKLYEGRTDPDVVFQFNAKYQALGKNAAEMILKDIDRRMTAGKAK